MLGTDAMHWFQHLSERKDSCIGNVVGISRKDGIDFCIKQDFEAFLDRSIDFDFCINCIAMTNTSYAEENLRGRIESWSTNALAPKMIAEVCAARGIKLIHISTDWVFSAAYHPDGIDVSEEPYPISVYGQHKLVGEKEIELAMLKAKKPSSYMIMRTSWLYGQPNFKSFVHKIILNAIRGLMSGKKELEVTSNEVSIPTSTEYVCDRLEYVINNWKNEVKKGNIKHCVPGFGDVQCSRSKFAEKILKSKHIANFEFNGTKLGDIKIVPVERDGYWPKFSALRSAWNYGGVDAFLESFMREYGLQAVDDAIQRVRREELLKQQEKTNTAS